MYKEYKHFVTGAIDPIEVVLQNKIENGQDLCQYTVKGYPDSLIGLPGIKEANKLRQFDMVICTPASHEELPIETIIAICSFNTWINI